MVIKMMIIKRIKKKKVKEQTTYFSKQEVNGLETSQQTQTATFDTTKSFYFLAERTFLWRIYIILQSKHNYL